MCHARVPSGERYRVVFAAGSDIGCETFNAGVVDGAVSRPQTWAAK